MQRELLEQLIRCSAELKRAFKVARDAGREDIVDEINCAKVDVCDAIALINTEKTVVELCS